MAFISDLRYASIIPDGLPLSLVGVIATVVIGIIYGILAKERPLAGFPLAAIEGQSPKKSWLFHGPQTITEALAKVCMPSEQILNSSTPLTQPTVLRPLPGHVRDWPENRLAQPVRR